MAATGGKINGQTLIGELKIVYSGQKGVRGKEMPGSLLRHPKSIDECPSLENCSSIYLNTDEEKNFF